MRRNFQPKIKQDLRRKDEADLCVVCFKPADIFSVGECDHPVCYECSTRMRVLLSVKECAICRKEMAQVVFLKKMSLKPFREIAFRTMSYESRYAIYFETDKEMQEYDILLEHSCPMCPPGKSATFTNFNILKEHVQRIHQLFYCDLCYDNLKLFSRERRAYNRTELAQHRRKGDTDDTSHRGHPLCKFCDARFMDTDELFRHLRKDHFYCHFCDADGSKEYYEDYPALRTHFKDSHYLCEDGDCRNEQFTSVFRNKLDRQAHHLEVHAESKHDIRQARTVDIEFTVNHGPSMVERGAGGRGRGRGGGRGGRNRFEEPVVESFNLPVVVPQQSIDINCAQDFPTLGAEASGSSASQGHKSFTHQAMRGNIASMHEAFPTLSSTHNRGGAAALPLFAGAASLPPPAVSTPSGSYPKTTTHVHLRVNTNKDRNGSVKPQKGPVSVECNKTARRGAGNSAPRPHNSHMSFNSKASYGGNKENVDEYPTLGNPSKSLGNVFRQVNITSSSAGAHSFSANASATTSSKNNSFFTKAKTTSRPTSSVNTFSISDFPTLAGGGVGNGMDFDDKNKGGGGNYSGMSKVSVPLKKPPPLAPVARQNSQKSSTNGSATNSVTKVGKKKKTRSEPLQQTLPITKRRQPKLNNIFDGSDEDESADHFTISKEGEYTSFAPSASSNVKVITREQIEAERKKSQLNIGELKPVPQFYSKGDFPSLGGGMSKKNITNDVSWVSGNKKSNSKNIGNTDMTFHNSYGESFSVSNNKSTTNGAMDSARTKDKNNKVVVWKEFIHPSSFDERNRNLIQTISEECGTNSSKFNKFKKMAKSLRAGTLEGNEYYSQCRELMGKEVMIKMLPELLLLLPDIEKQQGVFSGFKEMDSDSKCIAQQFISCSKCYQVLSPREKEHHDNMHMEQEFPSLSLRK